MSKAEERGKIYAIHKASEKLHDYYGLAMLSVVQFDGNDIKNAYKDGHQQAEKDLLENEHEKSWRLDKKLWKGIKGIERASYQYMYDASNDWAYDIPTWEDVQDAFKAGAEWQRENNK